MNGQSIRPARRWYWVAAGLLTAAVICIAFALTGFSSLGQQVRGFQRVQVPGQVQLSFTSPGRYLIYFEGPGFSSRSSTGTVQVLLQAADASSQVAISKLENETETYDLSGHSGQAVADFTIAKSGKYELRASQASSPAPADIAVGRSLGGGIGGTVVLILLAVLVFGPASVVIAGVTAVRRRRSRARALAAGPPQLTASNQRSGW
jgi:hypothetical protein